MKVGDKVYIINCKCRGVYSLYESEVVESGDNGKREYYLFTVTFPRRDFNGRNQIVVDEKPIHLQIPNESVNGRYEYKNEFCRISVFRDKQAVEQYLKYERLCIEETCRKELNNIDKILSEI